MAQLHDKDSVLLAHCSTWDTSFDATLRKELSLLLPFNSVEYHLFRFFQFVIRRRHQQILRLPHDSLIRTVRNFAESDLASYADDADLYSEIRMFSYFERRYAISIYIGLRHTNCPEHGFAMFGEQIILRRSDETFSLFRLCSPE